MNDLMPITYATEESDPLHRLLTSAAHGGIAVRVLGVAESWGFVRDQDDFSLLLTRGRRRG